MITVVLVILGLIATSLQACIDQATRQSDPWSVQLSQSSITFDNAFDAGFNGSSDDGQYVIEITGNQGKVTQNSRSTQVIVNNQIPWGNNLTLYSIIGADSTGIMMGWVYCSHDNRLTALWLEDTSGLAGFTNSSVTGSCDVSSASLNTSYAIQGECITVNTPPIYPSMQGRDVSLQPDNFGFVNLSQQYELLPFEIVDCMDCGSTSSNGWVEIHGVLSSKSSSNVCIGIFYLYAQKDPNPRVLLSYLNCFREQEKSTQWLPATYDISAYIPQVSQASQTSQTSQVSQTSQTSQTSQAPSTSTSTSNAAVNFPQTAVMNIVSLVVATIF